MLKLRQLHADRNTLKVRAKFMELICIDILNLDLAVMLFSHLLDNAQPDAGTALPGIRPGQGKISVKQLL